MKRDIKLVNVSIVYNRNPITEKLLKAQWTKIDSMIITAIQDI